MYPQSPKTVKKEISHSLDNDHPQYTRFCSIFLSFFSALVRIRNAQFQHLWLNNLKCGETGKVTDAICLGELYNLHLYTLIFDISETHRYSGPSSG